MRVLVTGGAGYIGSHACLLLRERGHDVVIVDSLVNSSAAVMARLAELGGGEFEFHRSDLRDDAGLEAAFAQAPIDAVVHFAGLKSVGESCADPLGYYDNNVSGTIALMRRMRAHGVRRIVFSSSATVYAGEQPMPVDESARLSPVNPYGETKRVIEGLLLAATRADPEFKTLSLRYFNPVGAHPSGRIGEHPNGPPNNLMPMICAVAVGRFDALPVFGNDWPTPDGSGVRDYLHVMDLARAHVDALEALDRGHCPPAINLGTGAGISVFELIRTFERVTGARVPYRIEGRRAGDLPAVVADPALALRALSWRALLGIDAMCRDAWRWQSMNPRGYDP